MFSLFSLLLRHCKFSPRIFWLSVRKNVCSLGGIFLLNDANTIFVCCQDKTHPETTRKIWKKRKIHFINFFSLQIVEFASNKIYCFRCCVWLTSICFLVLSFLCTYDGFFQMLWKTVLVTILCDVFSAANPIDTTTRSNGMNKFRIVGRALNMLMTFFFQETVFVVTAKSWESNVFLTASCGSFEIWAKF